MFITSIDLCDQTARARAEINFRGSKVGVNKKMAERADLPQAFVHSKRPRVSATLVNFVLPSYSFFLKLSDERHSSHPSRPVHPILTDDEPSSDSDSDTEPDMPAGRRLGRVSPHSATRTVRVQVWREQRLRAGCLPTR